MGIINGQIQPYTLASDRLTYLPVQALGSLSEQDMTSSSVENIYTVPSDSIAIVTGIVIEAGLTASVTAIPSISLGIAAGETDIFDTETLVNFDTTGATWANWLAFSRDRAGTAGETIKVNITGGTATFLVANIYLIGFVV